VVPSVVTTTFGALDAAIASDGTLVYASGGSPANLAGPRELVWVDRQGVETPIPAPPRAYTTPRLSPDDTRVALGALDQDRDLWIWDFAHRALRQFTFEPGSDANPLWTPDGRALIFSSNREGSTALYMQKADGAGPPAQVSDAVQRPRIPTAIARDGTRVVLTDLTQEGGRDLRLLTLGPTPRLEPLLQTTYEERNADLSPDGRWLVYESNRTGPFQIYVRPFPRVGDGLWPVSTAGGTQPVWARSGRELFFVAPDGAMMTVPVSPSEPTWSPGTPTKLFARTVSYQGSTRNYDTSRDGQRFLMIKQLGGSDQATGSVTLVVVQHWSAELARLVPTR